MQEMYVRIITAADVEGDVRGLQNQIAMLTGEDVALGKTLEDSK